MSTKPTARYDAGAANNVMLQVKTMRGAGVVAHNTVLQSLVGRNPVSFYEGRPGGHEGVRVTFAHNIVGLKDDTGYSFVQIEDIPAASWTIAEWDHNFYYNLDGASGHAAGARTVVRSTQHAGRGYVRSLLATYSPVISRSSTYLLTHHSLLYFAVHLITH